MISPCGSQPVQNAGAAETMLRLVGVTWSPSPRQV